MKIVAPNLNAIPLDHKPFIALQRRQLLIVSFVEGACVMVAELAGGKMLAPFYGTSLYVWASTLAITLGGLTIGYYLGGVYSMQPVAKKERTLFLTIAIAAVLVMLMPVLANFILIHSLSLSFLPGVIISQLCFLLPPVLCMGMVSPLLISLLASDNNSGRAAGSVYAISTLGGILATLLTGFWLVPLIGITIPCLIIGGLLFVLDVLLLRPRKKVIALLVLLFLTPGILFVQGIHNRDDDAAQVHVLYHSEGMLGQVKVIEFSSVEKGKHYRNRSMLVNHNWQTWVDPTQPNFSFLFYTRFTKAVIDALPAGNKVLLIGLGGGTVAKQMEARGISYDAVEIDGRLPELAQEYFGLQKKGNIIVDDGRHFINVCHAKYDLVIIDALLGENVPSHVLSVESFEKIKTLLQPSGKVMIEFDGIDKGETGEAQAILYNTILQAGLHCATYGSAPHSEEDDVIYLASIQPALDVHPVVDSDSYYPFHGPLDSFRIQLRPASTAVVTDNKPSIDYYLSARMMRFRQDFLKRFNETFLKMTWPSIFRKHRSKTLAGRQVMLSFVKVRNVRLNQYFCIQSISSFKSILLKQKT